MKSGGKSRGDTPNQIAAKRRLAERRRCPACGRKSALVRFSDEFQFGRYCRWDDCGYESIHLRM